MLAAVLSLLVAVEPLPSIVVVDLKPAAPADQRIAALATSALLEAIGAQSRGKAQVMGLAEAHTLIDTKAQQSLLGCDDERCTADLSNILKADQIVTGRVGTIGKRVIAFVSLIDVKTTSVVARASTDTPRSLAAIKSAMSQLAAGTRPDSPAALTATATALAMVLLDVDGDRGGDARIGSLRIAMLLDELDENGRPSLQHPIETCIQKGLLDAGADTVSPAVLAALRKQTSARELLSGRVPESLGSDDVDVILAGAGEIKSAGTYEGVIKMEAEASLQLVKIDTGDVLVSERIVGQGLEHSVTAAARRSVDKLCERATKQIQAALDRKVARGDRVVLEVAGALSSDDAKALISELGKRKRVGKVRLKKLSAQKGVFDVVVNDGDGGVLGLELGTGMPFTLDEVSGGLIKATWNNKK